MLLHSRTAVFAAIALVSMTTGCGGGAKHSQQQPSSHPKSAASTVSRQVCQAAWHCGTLVVLDGLHDAWPTVNAVYQNGNTYVVYTSLSVTSYQTASDVCVTAYESIYPPPASPTDIEVMSGGGPAQTTLLATGFTFGTGCVSTAP